MARKPKYSEEVADQIIDAIRQTGSDKAAWQTARIGETTYYRWLQEKRELKERVEAARAEYRENAPKIYIQRSQEVLYEYLFVGHKETWKSTEIQKDPEGNIIKTIERVFNSTKPTPCWVIDRILGKNTPLLEAVQVLLAEGVATIEQARIVSDGINRIEQQLKNLTEFPQAPEP